MKTTLRIIGIVAAAIVLSGCKTTPPGDLGYSRDIALQNIAWKEVRRFTFDNEQAFNGTKITNGKWTIRDGKLEAVEGQHERSILLMPCDLDPLRIEFDALCQPNPDGRIGDISVILNIAPDASYWKDGYLFTTASYYNVSSAFYRLGTRYANTEFSPVTPGKRHKVVLETCQGQTRYWIDGKVVLEAKEPAPLPRGENRWLGLRTYNTRLQVDNLIVSTGMLPQGHK